MRMIWGGHDLTIGADGMVPRAYPPGDSCCPDPLCINPCALACSFVDLLPSGPMWDRAKADALQALQSGDCEPDLSLMSCPSLVLHAVYSAQKLHMLVTDVLWPSIRESDPNTAVVTIDDWLERFQWEDCFRSHCRSVLLGTITPYEIEGECGPEYCAPAIPHDLDMAVKRGIIIAVNRTRRVGIMTLAALNWIIEPLGAVVRPANNQDYECGMDPDCCQPEFVIAPSGNTIPAVPSGDEPCGPAAQPPDPVQAWYGMGCDAPAGMPEKIYPGVVAAHCIVNSLMPSNCPSSISLACE